MAKMTVFKNGILADNAIEKTADYTVVSNTDSGKTFNVNSSITFTLPAIAIGNIFTFVYSGNDGEGNIILSPNSADGISYKGSATDNKDLILTLATAKRGAYVTIASLDQVVAWQVIDIKGEWVKEA